jgi:hypothetical protein
MTNEIKIALSIPLSTQNDELVMRIFYDQNMESIKHWQAYMLSSIFNNNELLDYLKTSGYIDPNNNNVIA